MLIAAGVALALVAQGSAPQRDKPPLALLTSLPLLFGEGFSIDAEKSAAATRLEAKYRLVPIGVADAASLKGQRLLLMAHPRAQPAEVLVELDQWVRDGGRVVVLADPRLDWDSERPLGDRLRPPPYFADTGLLLHWGVRLDGPSAEGPQARRGGVREVLTSSRGVLTRETQACAVDAGGFVATCRVGRGEAIVIADADFLNVAGSGAIDGPTAHNLDLLVDQLARAESR